MRTILFAVMLCMTLPLAAQDDLPEALQSLDDALAHRAQYLQAREQKIESLKTILSSADFSDGQRYMLTDRLIDEYIPYQADSTVEYLYTNIALATRMHDQQKLNTSRIKLAFLYSSVGVYIEAENALSQIDSTALSHEQLIYYYSVRHKLNDEMRLYTHDRNQSIKSQQLTEYYARLIVDNTPQDSAMNLHFRLWQAILYLRYSEAAALADKLCRMQPQNTREYAGAAFMRALVADLMEDAPTAQLWFARAATTDTQLAIRDNAALKNLANTLLDENNIQRAMRYMRYVMDDARFYNSRLRPWQDAQALHVIEQAYETHRRRMNHMYGFFALSAVCFLVLAVCGVVYVMRQNYKLRMARLELTQANSRLNKSNADMQSFNDRLVALNNQISEANEVKEEYIGIFLTMCSEYIDKMAEERRHVRRLVRDGRLDELKKECAATGVEEREVEEFYRNFDTTFMHLYPTFIEDFNAMLDSEARIEVRKGELLTTELRIFALIRLGINDSQKIATLLRYSVSTIYNYRSKIKNHTLFSREEFEQRIRTIGAFSPQHM